MSYDPNFQFDQNITDSHKWRTTISWASSADQEHAGLHAERQALQWEMLGDGRTYAPPIIVNETTTQRLFIDQDAAEHYVSEMQRLAIKYNVTIVSSGVDQI
jgi:hypothetical protein